MCPAKPAFPIYPKVSLCSGLDPPWRMGDNVHFNLGYFPPSMMTEDGQGQLARNGKSLKSRWQRAQAS